MRVCVFSVNPDDPFIADALLVNNSDGSVSFQLANGSYAGQEPNAYGVRNDNPGIGAYQKATLKGSVVTFVTRAGDAPMVYCCGVGQAY